MATDLTIPESIDPLLTLERMDEGFYALDRDWRFRYVNRQAEIFWNRTRAELLGRNMLEIFPLFAGSPPHAAHLRAIETQTPGRIETISTATGAPVELRFFPFADGLSVYFRDITQRQQLERDLQARDELLSLAESSAGIGVWVQDLPSATVTATPQYFRLLGVEPVAGPVSQDFVRRFRHPDDRERVIASFRAALERGDDFHEAEYRIVRPDGDERWIFGRGRVTRDATGKPWRFSGVDIDITARRRQDEHLRVVIGELLHRTNNLLAVVQSLAQQTARNSATLADFIPAFGDRLRGLSQSGTLLAREEWRGARLDQLVLGQASPFAAAERFELNGPDVLLSPRATQSLGLALHELCTNAVKYGALKRPLGKIGVRWELTPGPDETLRLSWTETGGPPVSPPTRKGFGRVVAEQLIASALDATVTTDYATAGVRWSVVIPKAEWSLPAAK